LGFDRGKVSGTMVVLGGQAGIYGTGVCPLRTITFRDQAENWTAYPRYAELPDPLLDSLSPR
jgi:hypothetical protein